MGKKTWWQKKDYVELEHDNEYLIAIVKTQWNADITDRLLESCRKSLIELGSKEDKILVIEVPGAFEIPSASQMIIHSKKPDAVITLGCVIKGQTDHDRYINQSISQGLVQLSLIERTPCIFGVLTTNDYDQALARANGDVENKGMECALSAIKMIKLKKELENRDKRNIGFLR